jgi:MoaA/NifB/PqqE/SkfB family radical SAM enzyme
MEEKIKRLIEWSKGKPQGPVSVHLDLTNRCNINCRFCWQRSHERKGLVDLSNELPEKRLLELVDEAKDLGVTEWLISGGGEPLVRTETALKVMKKIKMLGMQGDIITNGTLFKEEHIKDLVTCGWDRIRVSINSHKPRIHDHLTGSDGAFEATVKNIKLINNYKEKLNTLKPEIGFNTVINSLNFNDLHKIVKLLHKLKGQLINVQTLILYSEKEKIWALDEKKRKRFSKSIKKALKLAYKYNIHTNLSSYQDEELVEKSNELSQMDHIIQESVQQKKSFVNTYCFEPWYLVTIRANGLVGSCRLFGDKGVSVHNQKLKDIWFGEYYNQVRKRLVNHDLPKYCSNCGANEFTENQKIREKLEEYERNNQ